MLRINSDTKSKYIILAGNGILVLSIDKDNLKVYKFDKKKRKKGTKICYRTPSSQFCDSEKWRDYLPREAEQ